MSIKAGVSVRDITPEGAIALFGYPRTKRISTGVNDRLLVSALHLRTGSTGVIIISVDLMFLDPSTSESIIRRVSEAVSMPKERLFMGCTHTHSGPATAKVVSWMGDYTVPAPDAVYMEHVAAMIVEAASEAAATTTPVELAWTSTGNHFENGELCSNEADDHGAGLLVVRQLDVDKCLALVSICELCPSLMDATISMISADFPYYSRKYLQEQLGEQVVMIHFSAPSSDLVKPVSRDNDATSNVEYFGVEYGKSLKVAIDKLEPTDFTEDVPLAGRLKSVATICKPLPGLWDAQTCWGDSRAESERLKAEGAGKELQKAAQDAVIEAEGLVYMVRLQQGGMLPQMLAQYENVDVQVIQIADGFLVGLPGMISSDYARQIQEKENGKVFVASLVNGDLQGPLVSDSSSKEMPSVMPCPFALETAQLLVDAVKSII